MEDEFKMKYGFNAIQKFAQEKEKGLHRLQSGMNLDNLGMDVQKGPFKIISPFIDDNATQPDPLAKQPEKVRSKFVQKVNRKKEMFQQFSEETLIYIFYNVMDEEQQLCAVEQLYNKGWQYNYVQQLWFKDLQQTNKNLYQGKYFSLQNWKVQETSQIEAINWIFVHLINLLMNFIERFQLFKCTKHAQAPISHLCLNKDCNLEHTFCQNCVKLHLQHSTDVIYVKQIDTLLKRNTNVNEIVQDRQGLEAYNIFRSLKRKVEDRLNQIEEDLRKIILNLVNDQKINQYGFKFLQTLNEFNKDDIEDLRKFLISELQSIQNNQVDLKVKESKQKLIDLTKVLSDKIPNLEKNMLDTLDSVNSTFFVETQRIERLQKVWITDDGQSKPSILDKNTIRATVFQIRDKPLYIVGVFQPILYKGSYNSTNYDSQSKTPAIIYKIHEGLNLTNSIFKQTQILEHKNADAHLYYLEFKNPVKLLANKQYTLSISTKEQKSVFLYHYSLPNFDHPLIKWQSEDLTDSEQFVKGPYVQHIYSYANIDQVPAIMVKL